MAPDPIASAPGRRRVPPVLKALAALLATVALLTTSGLALRTGDVASSRGAVRQDSQPAPSVEGIVASTGDDTFAVDDKGEVTDVRLAGSARVWETTTSSTTTEVDAAAIDAGDRVTAVGAWDGEVLVARRVRLSSPSTTISSTTTPTTTATPAPVAPATTPPADEAPAPAPTGAEGAKPDGDRSGEAPGTDRDRATTTTTVGERGGERPDEHEGWDGDGDRDSDGSDGNRDGGGGRGWDGRGSTSYEWDGAESGEWDGAESGEWGDSTTWSAGGS